MTEINKAALAQETRLIEYWRKKYLFQAAAVAVCAGAAIAAAAVYIQAKLPALLIILAVLNGGIPVLRELRDSLQTRGETLIFAKGKALFDGVDFDYGQELTKTRHCSECGRLMRASAAALCPAEGLAWKKTGCTKQFPPAFLCSS